MSDWRSDNTRRLAPMMRLVLLTTLALLPLAHSRCTCSCSAQVVPFHTLGRRIHCSPLCSHYKNDVIGEECAAEARTAAEEKGAKCANASLEHDAASEETVRDYSQEWMHAGGGGAARGVSDFEDATADRCRAQIAVNMIAKRTHEPKMFAARRVLQVEALSVTSPPTIPTCDPKARYRSFDGTCNNLEHPLWGAADTAYTRLLCPAYGDGVYTARRAKGGGELPSARLLRKIFLKYDSSRTQSHSLTVLTMAMAQMVAHDIALTGSMRGARGLSILCCAEDANAPSRRVPLDTEPSSCIAVKGPDDYCMSVVRGTAIYNDAACFGNVSVVGPAEKVNTVTAAIDLSPVYGLNDDQARGLQGEDGKMDESTPNFPPVDPNSTCAPRPNTTFCYKTGDVRGNQNTFITMLQILLLCTHNKFAEELKKINPHWSSDTIFQETRKITIAVFQHIVYSEMLPLYIGQDSAEKHHLIPNPRCDGREESHYDPTLDISTLNVVTAACWRLGHGLIPKYINLKKKDDTDKCPEADLLLSDEMHKSEDIANPICRFGQLARTLTMQPAQRADTLVTIGMSEWLFRTANDLDPGQDLPAFDIQRCRDHGLPSYCEYLHLVAAARDDHCPCTWGDLEKHIDPEVVRKMMQVYNNPQDVDACMGMYMEKPSGYGLIGETCKKILIEQFTLKMNADRYFYTHRGVFTNAQLREIKKATAARLFCECGNITEIQPDCFFQPSMWNPIQSCDKIPKMNLMAWKD